jgi:hypothetical protein
VVQAWLGGGGGGVWPAEGGLADAWLAGVGVVAAGAGMNDAVPAGGSVDFFAPDSAARASATSSAQVLCRSSGDFAIARAITSSSAAGSSGRMALGRGGGSLTWANITARSFSRGNGTWPVTVS